jgi:hypothetical protein
MHVCNRIDNGLFVESEGAAVDDPEQQLFGKDVSTLLSLSLNDMKQTMR